MTLQNFSDTRAEFFANGISKQGMRSMLGVVALFCALFVKAQPVNSVIADPHLWLEEVQGEKALSWV